MNLTEKRLSDRRFRRAEEKIFKVFFEDEDYYTSAEKLAKKAGVSRSTFYRHHKATAFILLDYELFIIYKFKKSMRKIKNNKSATIRMIFSQIIVFVLMNKKIMIILNKRRNGRIFEKMIVVLKDQIMRLSKIPKLSERIFIVYVGEVVELLEEWGKKNFNEKEVDDLLDNIIYLTKTARKRLIGIK